jgi:hypothetical protein
MRGEVKMGGEVGGGVGEEVGKRLVLSKYGWTDEGGGKGQE